MNIYLILSLITIPLTVWRLSNMLSDIDQTGLFSSLDWIREKLGVRYDHYANPITEPGTIAEGALCIKCNSIWFGIIFAILLFVNHELTFFVSLPFALSAIVMFIEDWRNKDEES